MPQRYRGSVQDRAVLLSSAPDYAYDYPYGLNLRPGSELHDRIRDKILERARDSKNVMSNRYSSWQEVDETLSVYIKPTEKEKKVKQDEYQKPISIVIPMSLAIMETLLTYQVMTFLDSPIFRYGPVEPSDQPGVQMLEMIVEQQTIRGKAALALHTAWRDSLAYGFGAVSPIWETRDGLRTVTRPQLVWNEATGQYEEKGSYKDVEPSVLFAGNKLRNIDPYCFLPDPNVSIHDVQDGESIGWISRENRFNLLREEESEGSFLFNAKYLRHVPEATSELWTTYRRHGLRRERTTGETSELVEQLSKNTVDVIKMYVTLVPSDEEWKLGDGDRPEKWIFYLAGDSVVVAASRVGLTHGMYPVAIHAPEFDGYGISPISRMESIMGPQEVLDWEVNSRIANVRKVLNDMLVINPMWINEMDVRAPGPGKIIRMTPAGLNRSVDEAIKQLQITDVTAGHMADASFVTEVMKNVTGAVDSVQGIMSRRGERVTATESRDTRTSALSRLERVAKIGWIQLMYDLAYMVAKQTQQFMDRGQYVRLAGRWEDILRADYQMQGDHVLVSPFDINVDFDVVPTEGMSTDPSGAAFWMELFRIITGNPALMQVFDVVKVFKHAARLGGAKNLGDFIVRGGAVQAQTMPNEEVTTEVGRGNLVPLDTVSQPRMGGEAEGFEVGAGGY